MVLSKVEALEWAADYAERTKLFEIPPVSARDRYEIIDHLAEAAMLASPPSVRTVEKKVPENPECLEYIMDKVSKLRNSSNANNKIRYRDDIQKHITALKTPEAVHPPHPMPEAATVSSTDEDDYK